MLIVGMAIMPLFLAMTVAIARLYSVQRNNAVRLELQMATTASKEIESFIVSQFTVLEEMEILHAQFALEPRVRDELFERILFAHDAFTDITLVGEDGRDISRLNRVLSIAQGDLIDRKSREEFVRVQSEGLYLGPLTFVKGRPYFILGRALRDQNGFAGAVFATVDARILQEVVKSASVGGEKGIAYIVNSRGIVIAHPDLSTVLAEKDFSLVPAVHAHISGETGRRTDSTYTNTEGLEVLGAGMPITISLKSGESSRPRATGWYVIIEEPISIALAEAYRVTRFAVAVLAGVLLLAGGASLAFAHRIASPIEALHAASRSLSEGNMLSRVSVNTHDEIEDLAHAFNAMAEKLSRSITELKHKGEVLAAQKEIASAERNKIEIILSGITDAVIAVDLDRNIVLFNKAAVLLTGWRSHEVIGQTVHDVLKMFKGNVEMLPEQYCPVKNDGTEGIVHTDHNVRMISAKGREQSIDLVVGHIKEGGSVGLGCILSMHDLTHEEVLERIKREFVSIVAHQLRTPLTAIKWSLNSLMETKRIRASDAEKKYVENAFASTERMINLVNDLLNVARIEEGRFVYKPTLAHIGQILEAIVVMNKPDAERKRIGIVFKKTKRPIAQVRVDINAIQLAIQNIVNNAIRYTSRGGAVTITLQGTEREVRIEIADTGIGIGDEERDQLFTKFFRGEGAISAEPSGSGLGLFISKNIIKAHGGRIWFESEKGKGTTCFITLPIAS